MRYAVLVPMVLAAVVLAAGSAEGDPVEPRTAIDSPAEGPVESRRERAEPEVLVNRLAARIPLSRPRRGLDTTVRRQADVEARLERRDIGARDPLATLVPPPILRFGAPPSSLERVFDAVVRIQSQLVPGLVVWFLLFVFGRVFHGDRAMSRQARGARRSIRAWLVFVVLLVFSDLNLPALYRPLLLVALVILALAATQTLALYVVDAVLERARGLRLPVIVRDVAVMIVFIVLAMVTLNTFHFDLSGVLTGSAILTAVLGLAFQDTLGSLASGLALQLERPFAEDEWIQVEGFLGRVTEVNWRATKIVTHRNEVVILPNKLITNGKVINLSRPDPWHRREFRVPVGYEVPPNRVKALLEEAAHCDGVTTQPAPLCIIEEYAESAINYVLYFFITDILGNNRIEDRVRSNVWYQLQRAGIAIPLPIRLVHIEKKRPALPVDPDAEIQERMAAIGRIPFLDPLSETERRSLAESLLVCEYGGGETVLRQGDAGSSLYFIARGEVEVLVRAGESPQPRRLATLGSGGIFGEMSLMTGEPRNATIRALSDCTFFVVEREAFRSIVLSHEALSESIAATFAARAASLSDDRRAQTEDGQRPRGRSLEDKLLEKIRAFFGGSK